MKVYKYPIEVSDDRQKVVMPEGAKILKVESSPTPHIIWMWALVDPDATEYHRHFRVHGTGHQVNASDNYIGTVTPYPLVWHVFETY